MSYSALHAMKALAFHRSFEQYRDSSSKTACDEAKVRSKFLHHLTEK